jgi:O-succinylbenzoic acid--CoA ligase
VTSPAGARRLQALAVDGVPDPADLLPPLRAALSGAGPALALLATGTAPDRDLTEPDDDPTDPTAVAVTTSGSTGAPKTVLLPAGALLASAGATHDRLGGAGQWLLALPAQHVAGVQVLVRSLVAGTRPLAVAPGASGAEFAAAAAALRPGRAHYTALVPTQLVRLLADPDATAALRGFRAVLLGGAGAPPALLAAAADAGVRVVTTYGSSETCGGCVYDGVPLDGVTVDLATDGRVLLGGPTLARGYLDDPDGTARAFVAVDGARRYRTDDAGEQDDAGRLRILGRLDDMIVTGGVNVAPGPVEALLHGLPGVREAVVVGVPDPAWGHRVAAALVLAPGTAGPSLDEVRGRVRSALGPPSAPHQVEVLAELPLRGPGKPDRARIAELLTERAG